MSTGLYSGVSGLALGVGLYKGVPGLWGGASGLITGDGASLSLDFLTGNTLDPRVTFSRTTNATLVDNTGRVTYAPNNLVLRSEEFENASWGKNNLSVSANTSVAPNGTATADKLIPNTTIGGHQASAGVGTVSAGNLYVFSVYAKADGYNFIRLSFGSTAGGGIAFFNVLTGAIATTTGMLNTAIESVGNGWFRCSALRAAASTASFGGDVYAQSADNQFNWAGNGTDGVLAWGAQLEQVTYQTLPSTYNSTSPPNLLGFTEEFENAAWTKSNGSITANTIASPDGTIDADAFIENTAVSAFHFCYQAVTKAASNIAYAGSFYLKNKGRQVAFNIQNAAGSSGVQGRVNPATGAVTQNATTFGSGFAAGAITITDVGNGWYRVAMTATSDTSTSVAFNLILHNGTTAVYTGDGVSGAFLWGAQLSNSASVDPYVYNPGAAPTSTAYYGPRFDYNPVTLAPNGLLIEEQRVNLALQSALASGWTLSTVTRTVNATNAPDGTLTANLYSSTSADSSVSQLGIAVSASTAYIFSIYLRADAATTVSIYVVDSGGGSGNTSAVCNVTTQWQRFTVTRTTSVGTTSCSVQIGGGGTFSTGEAVYAWGAQLEVGSFATSYIPTVASTVTRTADIVTMTGTNFSSWYNQSEGTIIPQFVATTNGINSTGGSAFPFVYEIDSSAASTSNHQLILSAGYGPGWNEGTSILGVSQVSFQDAMTLGNANVRKIAYAYRTNDFAGCANGGTVLTDTSGTLPSPDRIGIGNQNASGSNVFTGYIRTLTYYPSRLSDAQLRALTA